MSERERERENKSTILKRSVEPVHGHTHTLSVCLSLSLSLSLSLQVRTNCCHSSEPNKWWKITHLVTIDNARERELASKKRQETESFMETSPTSSSDQSVVTKDAMAERQRKPARGEAVSTTPWQQLNGCNGDVDRHRRRRRFATFSVGRSGAPPDGNDANSHRLL